jgi:hypothetical protein
MKVIDLLNKIANGEEVPKEIRFRGRLCSYDKEDGDYYCEEYGNIVWFLIDTENMYEVLDTELEIIEEKDIEKLDIEENAMNRNERYIRKEDNKFVNLSVADYELATKINELIKAVNELKNK